MSGHNKISFLKLVTVIKTFVKDGRRKVQNLGFGQNDIQDTWEVAPYGIDTHPVKGQKGLYASTATYGNNFVIGYVNTNQKAAPGEVRIYSTSETDAKETKFFIQLKNDGTCLMGGDADNSVRYSPLDTGLQNMVTTINSNFSALYGALGITPVPPVNIDISGAKIEEIKTT